MTSTSPSASTIRVLISTRPGGFSLCLPVLRELFARHPELFDEPLPASEFTQAPQRVDESFHNCVQQEDQVYFLKPWDGEVRRNAWLLGQFDALGSAGLAGPYCSELKAVEVPADARWHIFEYEDGSEAVHEDHRVWS